MSKALSVINKNIFDKYEGDAFSNAKLNSFLQENNITEIEIIGGDGGGSVIGKAFLPESTYMYELIPIILGCIFGMVFGEFIQLGGEWIGKEINDWLFWYKYFNYNYNFFVS